MQNRTVILFLIVVLANRRIVQNKVVENAAVEIGHETADLKQEVLTKAELQSLFMIVLHQLIEKLLILLLEADLAGANVEPLDIVLGEEGVDGGSRAPCLATRFADEELDSLLWTNSKGFILLVVIAAARGEGESSKHHKSDSPEFHCIHLSVSIVTFNLMANHLALALAKLAQRLDVNAVYPEFLFHLFVIIPYYICRSD